MQTRIVLLVQGLALSLLVERFGGLTSSGRNVPLERVAAHVWDWPVVARARVLLLMVLGRDGRHVEARVSSPLLQGTAASVCAVDGHDDSVGVHGHHHGVHARGVPALH